MLDVIIPSVKNDLPMLSKCIESIRENVIDGVLDIYVISPNDEEIIDFCISHKVNFVDEFDFMGFKKDELGIGSRNGWFYQQLIKLNGDTISKTEDFLVIDADHVLLKPHIFVDGETYVFYTSDEYHYPYFNAINKLYGIGKQTSKSFISDKMIFNKKVLKEMKDGKWISSFIDSYDRSSYCGFSEFETYGSYMMSTYRDRCKLIDDERFMSMVKIESLTFDEMKDKYGQYKSITQHKFAK